MSDIETRIREALSAMGDDAPPPVGLVEAARVRLRRRRTARGVVGAVVLVAIAVPVAVSLGHGPDGRGDGTPVVASDSPLPGVASGWRTETWRDLTLQVPESWGHGSLDQWCVWDHGRPGGNGSVHRPQDAQTDVMCLPYQGSGMGYGIAFFDPDQDTRSWVKTPGEVWRYVPGDVAVYPEGAWLGYQVVANAGVEVVAEDQATAQRILDSAAQVDVDPNNCWTSQDTTHFGDYLDPEHLSICRYGPDGWLQQSELLSPQDTTTALSEIGHGSLVTGDTACAGTDDTQIVLGGQFVVTLTDQCPQGNQIALSGTIHELTDRDLYWALSPGWSGSWNQDWVPMPRQLRD